MLGKFSISYGFGDNQLFQFLKLYNYSKPWPSIIETWLWCILFINTLFCNYWLNERKRSYVQNAPPLQHLRSHFSIHTHRNYLPNPNPNSINSILINLSFSNIINIYCKTLNNFPISILQLWNTVKQVKLLLILIFAIK